MIVFKKLRFKNILSTGNVFTEIDLDRSPMTLVVGENGSGKSTMLDALCFALFGKPFRKINKPQLVNSVNQRDAICEVEFSIGKNEYKIIRGLKPAVFEFYANKILVNQTASARDYQEHIEKHVLKLNFNSFTQIVILGSSTFVPFMQLANQQRREIIEDLLDINVFSSMNMLLKERTTANKEDIANIKSLLQNDKEKLDIHLQHIKTIKTSSALRKEKTQAEIDITTDTIAALQTKIYDCNVKLATYVEAVSNQSAAQTKLDSIRTIEDKLQSNVRKFGKQITFFEKHDNCPTCSQDIDEAIKTAQIYNYDAKIETTSNALNDLNVELIKYKEMLDEFAVINKQIADTNIAVAQHNSNVTNALQYVAKLSSELAQNDNDGDLENEEQRSRDVTAQIAGHVSEHESLVSDREVLEVAISLLKDKGIKTQIVMRYIPIINKLINRFLASLEFFVQFELDEEFNETIKSRHRDVFSYSSFSEGEKLRVDLSLLLTWRAVAKIKNSMSTNLLILDEIFDASLDQAGAEEFLNLLDELSQKTNIFIISHRGDVLADKFANGIKFVKNKNFSQIER